MLVLVLVRCPSWRFPGCDAEVGVCHRESHGVNGLFVDDGTGTVMSGLGSTNESVGWARDGGEIEAGPWPGCGNIVMRSLRRGSWPQAKQSQAEQSQASKG